MQIELRRFGTYVTLHFLQDMGWPSHVWWYPYLTFVQTATRRFVSPVDLVFLNSLSLRCGFVYPLATVLTDGRGLLAFSNDKSATAVTGFLEHSSFAACWQMQVLLMRTPHPSQRWFLCATNGSSGPFLDLEDVWRASHERCWIGMWM